MTKHKIEMQIIYDGRKVQVWEFVSQGLNIGKWSTGKHCDGVPVVKNVKTVMCQECGTLPLTLLVYPIYLYLSSAKHIHTYVTNLVLGIALCNLFQNSSHRTFVPSGRLDALIVLPAKDVRSDT